MSKPGNDIAPPPLTHARIEELLRRGAESARELHKKLTRAHLAGYSRSMSLRLD